MCLSKSTCASTQRRRRRRPPRRSPQRSWPRRPAPPLRLLRLRWSGCGSPADRCRARGPRALARGGADSRKRRLVPSSHDHPRLRREPHRGAVHQQGRRHCPRSSKERVTFTFRPKKVVELPVFSLLSHQTHTIFLIFQTERVAYAKCGVLPMQNAALRLGEPRGGVRGGRGGGPGERGDDHPPGGGRCTT
jgi:hypothetical protein